MVAVLKPVIVPADFEGRRGSTDEGIVNVVSEVQLLSVEVGFGTFGAVSDALSPMVHASESESVKFVDQQGMVPSRVFPIPDGVAVEVADKQRRCRR